MAASRKRFIDDASAASLVRYGPELDALKELMLSTGSAYRQKVHSAQAGAAGIQAAVASAVPQLQQIYGTNPVAGIPGLSRAQALGDMISRGVRASESAAGARRTALQELGADRAKINLRRQGIAQEIGAFTSSEADKLASDAADRALRNRISLRSSGATIKAAQIRADASKGPGGVKLQTQAAHTKLASAISDARDVALPIAKTALKKKGSQTRNFVDSILRTGVDEPATKVPVYETIKTATGTKQQRKLNPDGTPVFQTTPATKVPKIPAAARGAALDLIFDGHISAKHLRQLHAAGFQVSQLGLPTRRNPQAPQVRLPKPRAARPYTRPGPRVA